jgi:hypothetical protein
MILPFKSIEALSVAEAIKSITTAPKKQIRDIKLFDFIMQGGTEISGVHGIYFYFAPDGETCLYVGKNSSQQYIERIPWHFAISEGSWQNHFLKYFRKYYNYGTLFEAAKKIGDCHILLMPVDAELIKNSEKFFRVFQNPQFNTLAAWRHLLDSVPLECNVKEAIQTRFN